MAVLREILKYKRQVNVNQSLGLSAPSHASLYHRGQRPLCQQSRQRLPRSSLRFITGAQRPLCQQSRRTSPSSLRFSPGSAPPPRAVETPLIASLYHRGSAPPLPAKPSEPPRSSLRFNWGSAPPPRSSEPYRTVSLPALRFALSTGPRGIALPAIKLSGSCPSVAHGVSSPCRFARWKMSAHSVRLNVTAFYVVRPRSATTERPTSYAETTRSLPFSLENEPLSFVHRLSPI